MSVNFFLDCGKQNGFLHGWLLVQSNGNTRASGLPGDFIKNQIRHSSLRVTSTYTHFEHQQKGDMAERLLQCTQKGSCTHCRTEVTAVEL